jgi:hypothetical protein
VTRTREGRPWHSIRRRPETATTGAPSAFPCPTLRPRKNGAWYRGHLSPSGATGIIIGGVAGSAIAGPVGALVGMVVGVAAGEALERKFPSSSDTAAAGRP